MGEDGREDDWRREVVENTNFKKEGRGRESIAADNKGTVSTVRGASAVHRGLKV